MESIRELAQKIKSFVIFPNPDVLVVVVVILVGFAGFGLGRLSVLDSQKELVKIFDESSQTASVISDYNSYSDIQAESISVSGEVVASKNGTKYHFPWCSGAQQISEKNLISFASIDEAKKAGYTPASNCKGLE